MVLYYNSEGDSQDFGPDVDDSIRKAAGYTFTSDPTAVSTTTSPPQSFQDTQIWVRDGKKYVVWQVPGQPFFMRYETTDEEINQFYSGRRKPTAKTVNDDVCETGALRTRTPKQKPVAPAPVTQQIRTQKTRGLCVD